MHSKHPMLYSKQDSKVNKGMKHIHIKTNLKNTEMANIMWMLPYNIMYCKSGMRTGQSFFTELLKSVNQRGAVITNSIFCTGSFWIMKKSDTHQRIIFFILFL